MAYTSKPFVLKRKLYNESTMKNEAFFEDLASARKEYDELLKACPRDHLKVVDLRNNQVHDDNRA